MIEPEKMDVVMQHAAMEAVVAQFRCDCETCAHTAAICPATASSYVQEIAQLRLALQEAQQKLQTLTHNFDKVFAERQESQQRVRELEHANNSWIHENETWKTERDQLRLALDEARRYIERMEGTVPDVSPGDVIASYPDGTIVLDDGITTWNPDRALEFATKTDHNLCQKDGTAWIPQGDTAHKLTVSQNECKQLRLALQEVQRKADDYDTLAFRLKEVKIALQESQQRVKELELTIAEQKFDGLLNMARIQEQQTIIQELAEALNRSNVALKDWQVTNLPRRFNDVIIKQAVDRIGNGVMSYTDKLISQNGAALANAAPWLRKEGDA